EALSNQPVVALGSGFWQDPAS
ncbi:MAG: hypothetical protein JWM80_3978, partial [Cyanobacteria bacterium RYN_339]|nr:hypothetical protein [Cyanobacteria bacterium RYN_339]